MISRRDFIHRSVTAGVASVLLPQLNLRGYSHAPQFDIEQITDGAKQHWMGYYDKQQIDPTGRYAVGNQVDPFFRSPTVKDTLNIGLIDLENGNSWTEIGSSTAWGWQQGCMLQWIPGSNEEVIWNDHDRGQGFLSKIYNIRTQQTRTLPKAIYTLSPDGSFALCVDMDRLQFFRPGYGYPTKRSKRFEKAPTTKGIYKMDLKTGRSELILSYAEIARLPGFPADISKNYHWFNHLLVNPSATRFIFLNRFRPKASYDEMSAFLEANPSWRKPGFSSHHMTRAITANVDGSDVYALNDSGTFSHFIWKGDDMITAWATTEKSRKAAFYEFPDKTKEFTMLDNEAMRVNGHNTYVPHTDNEWILNDTYPDPNDRKQTLYLYHVPTKKKVVLGRFHEPEIFTGEWRCDLHPRCDQQGNRVFFDSTHSGGTRQMYSVDIEKIVRG